ncbi:trypsin-like peptidase domain-containing protein [Helcobacillus massiliensis]|uniref:S1C family serine protease n=1 Tax=Helcobacillus massiliensis TaxID=521392 RepID=UPI0021A2F179|nr:trypsin-like peptidase domain-containing protein [Helcobacillus massiliensis]MCT1558341.1 trypsin-like peptidase domain-containing protein [Helcobacillus massiliensis]MCT2036567.1 trypsin-like peptidase domain-containing protein [Helcobacillus massiliensis]MCT2332330.1 trypsin-like peptidase domain-containing protein [Helcobacillus massiliensis]
MAPRSPGWCGTLALVATGMLVASGISIAGSTAINELSDSGDRSGPAITTAAPSAPPNPGNGKGGDDPSARWSQTIDQIGPSTVSIQVKSEEGSAEGTGIILDGEGRIVTNNHVVAGARQIAVTLADGRTFSAKPVGADPTTDVAVIALEQAPKDLKPAVFSDSDQLKVGQDVMAVGTPLGLANTATTGIISALNRPVTTMGEKADGSDATFISAVQTDASINPGNSGGPLVNANGEVIGINSSIASNATDERSAGSIGLGFAIPSNTVTMIAEQIIAGQDVKHALLGATAQDSATGGADATYRGAEVKDITGGGAAQKAGIRRGDVIIAVDQIPVGSASGLTAIVRGLQPGSEHTITLIRGDEKKDVRVTLGSM